MIGNNRRFWCSGPIILLLALGSGARIAVADPTQDWGLPQLMTDMRSVHTESAQFVEQKFEQLLNQPLQSSGTLTFVAPDRLQKRTLSPVRSRLTVQGDRLTIEQPDGQLRTLSLADVPELGALVASIRATLAGDIPTLSRYYSTTLLGGPAGWLLLLQPKDPRLHDVLSMIGIHGEGNAIHKIETVEHDGDRTVMTITPDAE